MDKLKHNLALRLCGGFCCTILFCGFEYLGAEKPHFAVSPTNPEIKFHLMEGMPSLKDKEKIKDGMYANLDDQAFWKVLVETAMEPWNTVPGSYVKLIVDSTPGTELNSSDQINTIGQEDVPATVAASALPTHSKGTISDCDITVSDAAGQSAEDLLPTLTHELGHCLGLGHNHLSYKSIMGYSVSSRKKSLSLDDMAGLVSLYPDPSTDSSYKEYVGCGVVAAQQKRIEKNDFFGLLALLLPFCVLLRPSKKACK